MKMSHLPKAGALVKGKGWLWTKASKKPKLPVSWPASWLNNGHGATYIFAELGKVGWWVCQLDVFCLDSQTEKQAAWSVYNPTSLQKRQPDAEMLVTSWSLCQHLSQLFWNLQECPGGPPWLPPRFLEKQQATPLHEFAPSLGGHIKANPSRDAWRWCSYCWER